MIDPKSSGDVTSLIFSAVMGAALLILVALSFSYAASASPKIYGDGLEYTAQLWALSEHLSPDLRLSDVERLLVHVQQNSVVGFRESFFSELREQIAASGPGNSLFFRDRYGRYYGLHFWFYSLLCVPMKWLLQVLQFNELRAFQMTNVVLLTLGLGYLFYISSLSLERKLTLSLLLFGIGVTYYLRWPHPEVYAAVTAFMASVAFIERRLLSATFFAGLCALQNPTAALMIPAIVLSQLDEWWLLRPSERATAAGRFALAGGCALVPFAFYYYCFGTPSLIGKEGYLNASNADLNRLYSLLFDLNQGMIVAAGWIFGCVCVIIGGRLVRSGTSIRPAGGVFHRDDWLLVAMILMGIGVLPQVNWNAGQSVYSRYVVWLCMPLIVWTVYQMKHVLLQPWWLRATVVFQFITVSLFGVFAGADEGTGYLQHKRIPAAILNRAPWAYNPEPEIFAERTLGQEIAIENWKRPILYRNAKDGTIKKILVHETRLDFLSEEACGPHMEIITAEGKSVRTTIPKRARFNFLYISGSLQCIALDAAGNSRSNRGF